MKIFDDILIGQLSEGLLQRSPESLNLFRDRESLVF